MNEMEVVLRDLGFDDTMISTIHDMMDPTDEDEDDFNRPKSGRRQHPSRAYMRDARAMKSTPADVVEFPTAYQFILDMPGLKPEKIKAHIEDGNVLVVSGEPRKRVTKQEGAKLLKMERRMGKMLKKFDLPENADNEKVSAVYEDGVLTVVVEKVKAPEVKKPRVIEVKIGCGTTTGEEALLKGDEGVKERSGGNWQETGKGSHGEGTDEYQGVLQDTGNLHDQTPGTQGDRVPQVAVL